MRKKGPSPRNRRILRHWRLAILAILLIYAVPRLWTSIRFTGKPQIPTVNGEFARFQQILTPAAESSVDSLHLGLPHNFFDRGAFLRAIWLSPTWSHHGYRFRLEEWRPSAEFRETLRRVIRDPASYVPYGGAKMCGGYHADFLVEVENAEGKSQFMVCLGCHEILLFTPRGSGIAEFSKAAYDELESAWDKESK